MSNVAYNYTNFFSSMNKFKMVDKDGSNRFDSPGFLFYKLFFYFSPTNGLLGTENIDFNTTDENLNAFEKNTIANADWKKMRDISFGNTAFNYLLINDEPERAWMLKKFITLLSEINANSPWYFQEITGLEELLNRNLYSKELNIEEDPKVLKINCLEDAYDTRISTLLDLYKAICYSYQSKRVVLPDNLRKFNMGILIFNYPIRGLSGKSGDKDAIAAVPQSTSKIDRYITNTKYFELRNCEIDANSSAAAYSSLKADEPIQLKHTINIKVDDVFESRYNELMGAVLGDFIERDITADTNMYDAVFTGSPIDYNELHMNNLKNDLYGKNYWTQNNPLGDPYKISAVINGEKQTTIAKLNGSGPNIQNALSNISKLSYSGVPYINAKDMNGNLDERGTVYKKGKYSHLRRTNNILSNLVNYGVGQLEAQADALVKKAYLGNIYGLSLADIGSGIDSLLSGDIGGVIGSGTRQFSENYSPQKTDVKGSLLPGYAESRAELQKKRQQKLAASARNNL